MVRTDCKTDLYFECHVTIEPVLPMYLEDLEYTADRHGFRVAKLLMQDGTTAADNGFCSARSTDYRDIRDRMVAFCKEAKDCGFGVRRYKIEDALVDSKEEGDWMHLL